VQYMKVYRAAVQSSRPVASPFTSETSPVPGGRSQDDSEPLRPAPSMKVFLPLLREARELAAALVHTLYHFASTRL